MVVVATVITRGSFDHAFDIFSHRDKLFLGDLLLVGQMIVMMVMMIVAMVVMVMAVIKLVSQCLRRGRHRDRN